MAIGVQGEKPSISQAGVPLLTGQIAPLGEGGKNFSHNTLRGAGRQKESRLHREPQSRGGRPRHVSFTKACGSSTR